MKHPSLIARGSKVQRPLNCSPKQNNTKTIFLGAEQKRLPNIVFLKAHLSQQNMQLHPDSTLNVLNNPSFMASKLPFCVFGVGTAR